MCTRSLWTILLTALVLSGIAVVTLFSQTIVINEVAWAGTKASPNDEWIELYNPSNGAIDLTGWTIVFGKVVIHLGSVEGATVEVRRSVVKPGAFLLLERSDDDTIFDIEADLIYKGSLPNSGVLIRLLDPNGLGVDTANAGHEGWAAGNATGELPYASMERIDPTKPDSPTNWRTNDGIIRCGHDADGGEINGTPRAKDAVTIAAKTAPVVKVLTPEEEGEKLRGLFIITWVATDLDDSSDRLRIDLFLSCDGGETWGLLIGGLANGGSYAWETTAFPDGETYQLKVTATDGDFLCGKWVTPIFSIINTL